MHNVSLEDAPVPGFVPYGNERVNIYDLQNRSVGHVITEDSVVAAVGCQTVDEPTYEVYVQDLATVDRILHSESPLNQLQDEKRARNVRIEGTSLAKRVKQGFTMTAARVLGWLGF